MISIRPPIGNLAAIPPSMQSLVASIEDLLREIIPQKMQLMNEEDFFIALDATLPLPHSTLVLEEHSGTASLSVLCQADHTLGTGRYLCDVCSRWILPGKQLPMTSVRALPFEFTKRPGKKYFVSEFSAYLGEEIDIDLLKKNFIKLKRDVRLTIMAVRRARQIATSEKLSAEEQQFIMEENVSRLLSMREKEIEPSLFDYAHHMLTAAVAEKKRADLSTELSHRMKKGTPFFEADIFTEMQLFVMTLKDSFIAPRSLFHVHRAIAYQYLFRKKLLYELSVQPERRHVSVKISPTTLRLPHAVHSVLGITVALNLNGETELFNSKHLLQAIQTFIPGVTNVKKSEISAPTELKNLCIFYAESKKANNEPFTREEIATLKERLPREIQNRIETIAHPIFMHRNEEEVMRNVVALSQQIKYIHDIPQVIITFNKQTKDELVFTTILVRIQKEGMPSVKNLFHKHSSYCITNCEVKAVGTLRKRYTKEAAIFEVSFPKEKFLRKNFSLDLYKARQSLIRELMKSLGDIRDFNGGMISKQNERLSELRSILQREQISNDFLLENFFYSLSPPQMQSLLPSSILACLFTLLVESLDHNFSHDPIRFTSADFEGYAIFLLATVDPNFIEFISQIVSDLDLVFPEFTGSQVQTYEIYTLGYLMRLEDERSASLFADVLKKATKSWKASLQCEITTQGVLI